MLPNKKASVEHLLRLFSFVKSLFTRLRTNAFVASILLLNFAIGCSSLNFNSDLVDQSRPNVLLIVVDDMGSADIGIYGSEINTPNLDKLAQQGILFTNFHASPVCSATRAMLLTGVDNHLSGFGNMAEELAPNQSDKLGYEGELNDRVITLATLLRNNGYATYISGKWHLGLSDKASPKERGFDRSFTMLAGGASHYSDMRPAYNPDPDGVAPYRKDGVMLKELPNDFVYSTQFFTDQMIKYIGEQKNDKPFFAYLSYTAPHWPLQAPEETISKYKGVYDSGYNKILENRLEKQKALGIVPVTAISNPPTLKSAGWETLSDEDKRIQIRSMEIYAAMVDEIDQHIGRLITHLERQGLLENTIVMFMSDNGAEGHDLDETWPANLFPKIRHNIDSRHDFSYENMGKPNSYVLYGPDWARTGNPAYRLHKGFPTEGGTLVPAFVTFPKKFKSGTRHHFVSVIDVMPTLLDLLNIPHPAQTKQSADLESMTGISMLSSLRGRKSTKSNSERVLVGEILGKYYVRKGDWKLVFVPAPYGPAKWQLFNLSVDLTETNDLSDAHPEIVAELADEWTNYVKDYNVILPDWVSGY